MIIIIKKEVIWNHIIVYKVLTFDKNTWNDTIVYNLFVLDRNTWYITVCKKKRLHQKCK